VRLVKKSWLVGLLVLLGIVLFYPIESTVVPEWAAHVVDERGNSLPNVRVIEHWHHFSIEIHGHEEEALTDEHGYVTFPRRSIRASLFMRVLGPLRNVLQTGVHSSFGPVASLVILTGFEHSTENADYQPGHPPPQEVVVRRIR